MSYPLTILVVALTALTWLLFVTVPPDFAWAETLRHFAAFLTAVSAARLAEFVVSLLIGKERSEQHKTTDLVRVISKAAIYLVALIAWLYYGLGFNVTHLLATSAVLTIVIGLALQSTLGNLFSGLALELERPLRVGDYMRRSPVEGTIEGLTWRSIFLRASNGSLIVVPNSGLSASQVEVFQAGTPTYHTTAFHVPAIYPPTMVQDVMRAALQTGTIHAAILRDPAPRALILGSEPERGAFRYGARIYTSRPSELTSIFSAVLTRLWYALDRHGIPMASISEQGDFPRAYPPGPFRFKPPVVPAALVAAGRVLRFGSGEAIPDELVGILTEGLVLEDMLDGELDIEQALASLSDPTANVPRGTRLAASAQAEIVRQATTFLGPVAATLTDHYAALTDDPFLVYRTVSTHIQVDKERARFLASAPARPVRRLVPGDAIGWRGLLGLEAAGGRRRVVPTDAALVAFTYEHLKVLLAGPEAEHLIAVLAASSATHALSRTELRSRLERLVA
jgi:small-conductance mechanosensitive channel